FLRGPSYQEIWVSIGIKVVAGYSAAQVREDVKKAVTTFLAPLQPAGSTVPGPPTFLTAPPVVDSSKGWPLRKSVFKAELASVASRVDGVELVQDVLVAKGTADPASEIPFRGLQLPRLMGISVTVGDPSTLDQLRGQASSTGQVTSPRVAVPVIPEECA